MIRKSLVTACLLMAFNHQTCFSNQTIDPEELFQQAMKYRSDGEVFKAIEVFETILSHQPGLNRARLELAISYHLTKRYEDARQQLLHVLNDPETPDKVKLSITAYLAQLSIDIKSTPPRSLSSFYLSFGALSDSNINLSPDLPGIVSEKSAGGGQIMLSYSNRSRATQNFHIAGKMVNFEWLTQASLYSKAYASGHSDFNFSNLSFNTGPALIADKNWRGAFNFKFEKLYFANQDYAKYVGINPFFSLSFYNNLEITFENITSHREYNQSINAGLTGTMTSWSMDVSRQFSDYKSGIQGGVKYHDNGADAGFLHYNGAEIYIGAQVPAWQDARAYLTVSSRDYRYMAADITSGFTEKRDETELLSLLGINHNFHSGFLKSWTLNMEYSYTRNNSNIDEFDYDRNTIELNLNRYFF